MRIDLGIFERLGSGVRERGRLVLATVLAHTGSTPGKPGQKMIVFPGGEIDGTIGGGSFEALVIQDALEFMEVPGSAVAERQFRFSDRGEGEDTGMVCGGTIRVLLERLAVPEVLAIFGGGHIGKALAALGVLCDFRVLVADDRTANLDPSYYAASVERIELGSFGETGFFAAQANSDVFAVLVTRCWETDLAVLRGLLARSPERLVYVGMIGSRRKVGTVRQCLKADGYGSADWDKIHAPIGLDIVAQTPAEIAISIMGQIIDIRNRHEIGTPARSPRSSNEETLIEP